MSKMTKTEGRWEHKKTVLAGANDVLYMPRLFNRPPATVGVSPGAGGTALVEYTLAPYADVEADPSAVTWRAWPEGNVSSDTDELLEGPVTALRMTATTADADWEVLV